VRYVYSEYNGFKGKNPIDVQQIKTDIIQPKISMNITQKKNT